MLKDYEEFLVDNTVGSVHTSKRNRQVKEKYPDITMDVMNPKIVQGF